MFQYCLLKINKDFSESHDKVLYLEFIDNVMLYQLNSYFQAYPSIALILQPHFTCHFNDDEYETKNNLKNNITYKNDII